MRELPERFERLVDLFFQFVAVSISSPSMRGWLASLVAVQVLVQAAKARHIWPKRVSPSRP
ncbi:protein of unknown function (plasmid) [Methylocella tundrae]|uniref:Uncharacterized protein n=1 Tax=Methylocella tundrae TaxID=227605 RepID=A0A4U8Z711_METTU|nr:protein of unknown function [Methylocella tundrae]